MTKTTSSHQSIGQRLGKVDGLEKITGKARFAADINEPGMLLGKILRSPCLLYTSPSPRAQRGSRMPSSA